MIATTTTLFSGPNPSTYGDAVTLGVAVGHAGFGPIETGTVTFFLGGVAIGTVAITGHGDGATATLSVATLPAGSDSITATYSGDGNYSSSASSALTQTVNKRTPYIAVSSSVTPSVYGQAVTFTALGDFTGPSGVPAPTGTATFYNGGVSLGTAPFVPLSTGRSSAVLTVANLPVGSLSITVSYGGDNNYNSSTSPAWTQTVNKASTSAVVSSSPNPSALCQPATFTATVTAVSPGSGVATGTVTFTIDGTAGSPIALTNGVASYATSTLTQASHSVSAAYNGDGNFNASTSSMLTQTVNAPTNWVLSAAPAAADPEQAQVVVVGSASVDLVAGGLLAVAAAIDAAQSAHCDCGCECKDDAVEAGAIPIELAYSASTLNVKPIIIATLASDFCAAVPSQIQVQLTWNGTAQAIVTLATTGHAAGDVYNLPLQVNGPVAASGIYAWTVQAWATVGATVYNRSVSGVMPVVVNSASPFGIGHSLRGTWSLLIGGAGVAVAEGTGGTRYFTGTPGALPYTFTSPANDKGTLVKNADGSYTYTAKNQLKTNFDSGGRLTSQVDARGLARSFVYAGGQLSTITQPDGGVATLSYASGLLASVSMPGGRSLTLTYTGSDLTGIVDAAGGTRTLAYDANHRLINERSGTLNTTYAYAANGTLQSIDRGLGTVTTITPAAVRGLGAGTAINASQAVAVVADALGHATSYTLDALGRATKLLTADGAVQFWTLNAAGNPTSYTDALGRTTTNTYNAAEDLLQVLHADGTSKNFQYDATFHKIARIQDELNRSTNMSYDATTGDLLSVVDAANNTTTYTWSNGLKQTMTDALGRATSYTWDTAKRRELTVKDALNNVTTFGYDAAGNRNSTQDALGQITSATFDGNRRELTRTNALGGVASTAYDAPGNPTSSTDELSRVTNYAYDQRGLRTSVTEAVGTAQQRTTNNTYDAAGNLLSATDPLGDITRFGYDARNRPTQRIEAFGTGLQRTTTTDFDLAGNVAATTDARGTVTRFAYDLRNRRTQKIEAYGTALQRTTGTSYDAVGNVATTTNPRGVVTAFVYDALNRPTARTEAYGTSLARTTSTTYDAVNNILSVTNAIGAVTRNTFDALNRKTQVVEAYGSSVARTSSATFDAVSNVLTTTNARGIVTHLGYDALNRNTTRIQAYGTGLQRTIAMSYDAVNNLLSVTNPLGAVTRFAYDALDRRVSRTDAYGTSLARTLQTTYDADDNVTANIDALGNSTNFGYDALNRRISARNPDGGTATTGYDANDNVVQTIDPLGNATAYTFDVLNRKSQTTDARGGIVSLIYDSNNNLLSLIDPVNNKTQWLYDLLDRKVQEIDPLSNIATMVYDAIDRLTSTTDKLGQVVNYTYDLLNRQTSATGYSGSGLLNFTFDPNDNLLTAANSVGTITNTFDALDRLATALDVYGILLTYTRDLADNKTLVQDSFGGQIARAFDVLNRATTLQFSATGQALRQDFAYTVRDQVAALTRYSNLAGTTLVGTSAMQYDSVGRPTNLQHLNASSANIANYANSFDLASRITSEILNGGPATNYLYDVVDEITNDGVAGYSYDVNGNRTMPGYSTGPNNQITSDGTSNYYADKNGNIIQKTNIATGEVFSYSFDNRNRMSGATRTTSAGLQMQATYLHDASGRRVEADVTISGVTTATRFAFDDTNQIFADTNGSNVLQTRYILGQSVLERFARISSAGVVAWLLQDRLGSVRHVVDSGGVLICAIVFDSYGNIVSQSNPSAAGVYLWVGYRLDPETGLLRADMSWRYYDPITGRWYSVDPIGFAGGSVSLWEYVGNNPVNWVDPTGLVNPLGVTDVEYKYIEKYLKGEIPRSILTQNVSPAAIETAAASYEQISRKVVDPNTTAQQAF